MGKLRQILHRYPWGLGGRGAGRVYSESECWDVELVLAIIHTYYIQFFFLSPLSPTAWLG